VDKGTKTIKERQGGRTEDTKEIIPSWISTGLLHQLKLNSTYKF
jgi:hypothetical protein